MDNQHKKIKGYRDLSQYEIDLMNKIKDIGVELDALISVSLVHCSEQFNATDNGGDDLEEYERLCSAEPHKWIQLATDHFQQGLMCLTRSVAQPTSF